MSQKNVNLPVAQSQRIEGTNFWRERERERESISSQSPSSPHPPRGRRLSLSPSKIVLLPLVPVDCEYRIYSIKRRGVYYIFCDSRAAFIRSGVYLKAK